YVACSSFLLVYRFCFDDPSAADIYSLSLHDALPICLSVLLRQLGLHAFDVEVHRCQVLGGCGLAFGDAHLTGLILDRAGEGMEGDRKSTRLNSSHVKISYAVFCLKKKKKSIGSVDK